MKTNAILLSLLFCIIGSFSYAQQDSTEQNSNAVDAENYIPQSKFRPLRLGIYGELGFSWMMPKTTGYESDGIGFAYSYGLLVDFNFTENYTFSSGIGVNSLSGALSYEDSIIVNNEGARGIMHRNYRINYVEIPTLLKLKTNQMGYLTYFAQLGLRHNFAISSFANDEFIYESGDSEQTATYEDIDMQDYTHFYRLSFSFGLGVEYAISQSFSAYGAINYDNGLTDVLSNENSYTGEEEIAFLKKFGVTVGLLF